MDYNPEIHTNFMDYVSEKIILIKKILIFRIILLLLRTKP